MKSREKRVVAAAGKLKCLAGLIAIHTHCNVGPGNGPSKKAEAGSGFRYKEIEVLLRRSGPTPDSAESAIWRTSI